MALSKHFTDGKQQTQHKSKLKSATEDGKMGGALHKPRRGQTRFTDKVRVYPQKSLRLDLREVGRKNLFK